MFNTNKYSCISTKWVPEISLRETHNHTFNQEISNSVTTGLPRGPVSLSHRVERQILSVLLYIRLYFLPSPNCMSTSKADYCFVVLCFMVAYDVVVTSPDTLWEESTQKHVTGVLFSDTRTKCAPTKETKKNVPSSYITPHESEFHYSLGSLLPFFQKLYLLFSYVNECLVCSHICVARACLLPVEGRREHWVSYSWSYRWL